MCAHGIAQIHFFKIQSKVAVCFQFDQYQKSFVQSNVESGPLWPLYCNHCNVNNFPYQKRHPNRICKSIACFPFLIHGTINYCGMQCTSCFQQERLTQHFCSFQLHGDLVLWQAYQIPFWLSASEVEFHSPVK